METCLAVQKQVIRGHYDLSTPFYRLLWGPHIHHGFWEADESPLVAQVQLTQRLAARARIAGGERVLDVGCGMGGSSIYLARTHGCRVTGITLSPLQRRWAGFASRWHGVQRRTEFRCADAEAIALAAETFDVVWSIECTEHLFDKPRFFANAASWVKPGGRIAICAWLAGDKLDRDDQRQQVQDVCEGFFCPSLGSRRDYLAWLEAAGLTVETVEDWTSRVVRTWEICQQRVRRSGVRWLARLIDRDSVMFLDRFQTILAAYRSGAMQYGCFVARR